jgi:hypothetical protein
MIYICVTLLCFFLHGCSELSGQKPQRRRFYRRWCYLAILAINLVIWFKEGLT